MKVAEIVAAHEQGSVVWLKSKVVQQYCEEKPDVGVPLRKYSGDSGGYTATDWTQNYLLPCYIHKPHTTLRNGESHVEDGREVRSMREVRIPWGIDEDSLELLFVYALVNGRNLYASPGERDQRHFVSTAANWLMGIINSRLAGCLSGYIDAINAAYPGAEATEVPQRARQYRRRNQVPDHTIRMNKSAIAARFNMTPAQGDFLLRTSIGGHIDMGSQMFLDVFHETFQSNPRLLAIRPHEHIRQLMPGATP